MINPKETASSRTRNENGISTETSTVKEQDTTTTTRETSITPEDAVEAEDAGEAVGEAAAEEDRTAAVKIDPKTASKAVSNTEAVSNRGSYLKK